MLLTVYIISCKLQLKILFSNFFIYLNKYLWRIIILMAINNEKKCPLSTGNNVFPKKLTTKNVVIPFLVMLFSIAILPFAEFNWKFTYNLLNSLYIDDFFSTAKQFATITTIASIVIIIWLFDLKNRKYVFILLLALGISGITNEIIKQTTGRARPNYSINIDKDQIKKINKYLQEHPESPIKAEPYDQWLLFKKNRHYFDDNYSSFPSGHSNAGFVIAAFLIVLYPRGRILWFIIAFGCALARVRFRRHFPEDILFGGGLGWLIAQLVFSWRWATEFSFYLSNLLIRKIKINKTQNDNLKD